MSMNSVNWQVETENVTCVLCGRHETTPWLTVNCQERPAERFHIVQCGDCGLRYLNPRPTRNVIAAYYPVEYFSQQSTEVVSREHLQRVALWQRLDLLPPPIEARRAKLLSKTIRRLLWGVFGPRSVRALPAQTSADRFLDIGCGVGIRLDMAADLCWRTYGIDLSGEAVAQARSRGHQAALSGAEVLPFADQSMVYVNLSHVLEHTFDPVAAFKEARRVLRPGGLIDVAVPNAGAWSARRLGASWGPYDAPRHLYHFTPLTLQALAKTAGLDALLIRTVAEAWGLRRSKPNPAVDDPITQADRRMQALQARFRQGDELQMWCTRGIRS